MFTGTWLAQSRLPLGQCLWLLKWFELEVTAYQAARQPGVSSPTAWQVFRTVRRAILAPEAPALLQRDVEVDESDFGGHRTGVRGRGARGNLPVCGLLDRHGRVSAPVVPNVTQATRLHATSTLVKRGSLISIDKWQALMP